MLRQRGEQNGLKNIKLLKKEELSEYEPYACGEAALFVGDTGIVDYKEVSKKYLEKILQLGGVALFKQRVVKIDKRASGFLIKTDSGAEYRTKKLINCAGLHSDLICKMQGIDPGLQIIPFRGEYYTIKKERQQLVKNLIYPVPDIRFPFLGVHFTRMIDGRREAGPNAVLAFKREGYCRNSFSFSDVLRFGTYPGFWLMSLKYWQMGLKEFYRSWSKRAFLKALQKMVPEISLDDLEEGGAGVRAQALDLRGRLLDDFCLKISADAVNVLNAPSPAATASLSIGAIIADAFFENFYQ